MSSPAPAPQSLTPTHHPQSDRRRRGGRARPVEDLRVARLATSHQTEVGGEWDERIERAINLN
eukprot:1727327-Pleurochrysis_carterae.AAC.2